MIELKAKAVFFDRAAVLDAVDRARLAVLSKYGAFVRRRARSSIRKRRKSAAAGQPPSSHVGTLKNLIFFSYDESTKSVVIGPEPFGAGTAPQALEYGGSSLIQPRHAAKRRKAAARTGNYEPHPFMGPANAAEAANLPSLFIDSVH